VQYIVRDKLDAIPFCTLKKTDLIRGNFACMSHHVFHEITNNDDDPTKT